MNNTCVDGSTYMVSELTFIAVMKSREDVDIKSKINPPLT